MLSTLKETKVHTVSAGLQAAVPDTHNQLPRELLEHEKRVCSLGLRLSQARGTAKHCLRSIGRHIPQVILLLKTWHIWQSEIWRVRSKRLVLMFRHPVWECKIKLNAWRNKTPKNIFGQPSNNVH
jgi:hypothetical protein